MTTILRTSFVALAVGLVACGGERPDSGGEEVRAPADTGGQMEGMGHMQGMGSMVDTAMMQQMREHMQAMTGAGADRMKGMMPEHRQMAANMLAQMNREMEQMNMAGDATWRATADSVRQDLIRMPGMGAAELKDFMPAHQERMMRLMEMHRKMMQNMEM